MIRIQRYLLGELLSAFALVLLIVTTMFFGGMLLQFLHRTAGLELTTVLKGAPFLLPLALPLTVPFALLIACLLTYGRFADDNEFTALRMGGVHPWNAVAPAICVGAILSIATVFLNTDVIPVAVVQKKTVARDEIGRLVLAVGRQPAGDIRMGDKLRISWSGRTDDGWLEDVLITFKREEDLADGTTEQTTHHVHCGQARVRVAGDALVIDARDMYTEIVGRDGATTRVEEKEATLSFPYAQITSRSPDRRPKGDDEMSGAEIYYRIRRATVDDHVHDFQAEYWARIALGLSPLAFALLGAPLGLATARGSRMFSVLLAMFIALVLYHPLTRLGENLAASGSLAAPLALNLGNLLLAAIGLFYLRRVVRA